MVSLWNYHCMREIGTDTICYSYKEYQKKSHFIPAEVELFDGKAVYGWVGCCLGPRNLILANKKMIIVYNLFCYFSEIIYTNPITFEISIEHTYQVFLNHHP